MTHLVYIVGNQGNMAKRYQAILNKLGVKHIGHDKEEPWHFAAHEASCFIICTPTERHLKDIDLALQFDKPILCEKPLTKSLADLQWSKDHWGKKIELIKMVNQYSYIEGVSEKSNENTYYNYFKTGNDSLYWDCINIIGLARDSVRIENTSPVWACAINGKMLLHKQVEVAYCDMIEDWLANPVTNWEYAFLAHEKVAVMEALRCQKC